MSEVTWPGVQVPGGHHYQQQPDLSHQFGGLSLQDPAFLQELQRIETQKQFGGQQQHVPDVYMAGPGQPGLVPGPATMGSLPTVPMGGGSTGTDRERGGGRVTNLSNIQSLVSYLIQPQSTAGYLMEQCEENFSNNLFDLNLSHTALAMSKFHNFVNHLVLIIQLYKPKPRSLRILLNLIVDIQSLKNR